MTHNVFGGTLKLAQSLTYSLAKYWYRDIVSTLSIEIENVYQCFTASDLGGFESDGQQMEFVSSYPELTPWYIMRPVRRFGLY